MSKDEIDLILQVQQWDLDSFASLYEKYFQKIYTFTLMKANWNGWRCNSDYIYESIWKY